MDKQAVINNNEAVQTIFNVITDAVMLHPLVENGMGKFSMVNKTACDRYGYSYEEFLELTADSISLIDEAEKSRRRAAIARISEEGRVIFETTHVTRKGLEFPVEINASVISFNGQKTIVSVVRDITERKKEEQEEKENARLIRAIFTVAPSGIGVVSNRVFTMVNDTFCNMIGYSREELIGQSSRMIYPTKHDYDKAGKDKYQQIALKGTGSVETRFMNKDGRIMDGILASTPLDPDDYSKGVIFTAWDITERKNLERELEQKRNNLEKLVEERTEEIRSVNQELTIQNRIVSEQKEEMERNLELLKKKEAQLIQAEKMASLGILTAGVAHEINNPLNYIMGGYSGLEAYFRNNKIEDEDVRTMLELIKSGIEKASAIVTGLNQFSRDRDIYDEECDVHEIIENCLLILNNKLVERIKVRKEFTGESFLVKGNIGKLHQVFINIILNSIQAIENNGNIKISTFPEDGFLQIRISDNGAGIKAEDLPKVTDPFFTTKDPGEGTGLGLSIVYSIISDHRGKLEYESRVNEGTTAIISLPVVKEN